MGEKLTEDAPWLTLIFGYMQYEFISYYLAVSNLSDIWGASKNLLLYVKPTTLLEATNGYAIITSRYNIQKVISTFATYYKNLLGQYAQQNKYPINGPVEIRVTGLDVPEVVTKGESPALSAVCPIKTHPEFDTAVWVAILSFPNTPHLNEFMRKIESFLFNTFNGINATVRPEWSKGWAYTDQSAWSNKTVMENIRRSFPSGSEDDGWDWAVSTLNEYDPHRIFINPFLDELLVRD
jgi:hypothetical protein